jgi:hypothetical protein
MLILQLSILYLMAALVVAIVGESLAVLLAIIYKML